MKSTHAHPSPQAIRNTCRPPRLTIRHDGRRIPIWPEPPKVPKKDLPTFCPKEYRGTIIEKIRRHACQHPLIPLQLDNGDTATLSADEIHEGCVRDMYAYCFANDLSQVWAYLWNCWYTPSKWALWARASCSLIPRIRTTMIVESFWKSFKHHVLTHFRRPRLDLVTHLIIHDVLNRLNLKLDYILGIRRTGRGKPLYPWQGEFKGIWIDGSKSDERRRVDKELIVRKAARKTARSRRERAQELEWIREDETRAAGSYTTSLTNWTCSCLSYLLSRFLICKHLIRAANVVLGINYETGKRLPMTFFYKLRRNHFPPFYFIDGIHNHPESDAPAPTVSKDDDDIPIVDPEDAEGQSDREDTQQREDNPPALPLQELSQVRSSSPGLGDDDIWAESDEENVTRDGLHRVCLCLDLVPHSLTPPFVTRFTLPKHMWRILNKRWTSSRPISRTLADSTHV